MPAAGPVPTARLAARAPESPPAARPRAVSRSGRTVPPAPARPASRCSARGSPHGGWRGPGCGLLSRPLAPRPAEAKGSRTREPPPFSQFEPGAGTLGAEASAPGGKCPETQTAAAAGFRAEAERAASRATQAAAMEAVGGGLVDCHCHLAAPDFDRVCEGEAGPWERGGPRPHRTCPGYLCSPF